MLETNRNKAGAQQAAHHAIGIVSEKQSDGRSANATLILDKVDTSPEKIVNPDASIRDVEDDDAGGLVQIIAAIMGEFPGCVFDLEADFPELKQPKSSFARDGGRFWVVESSAISTAEHDNRSSGAVSEIVGCFGFLPAEDPEGIELQRVYLRPELRGTGLATRMFKIVRAVAHQRSARFIELWTDSRFKAAQRFYEKLGFERLPNERLLNDRSRSSEYHYILPLR